MTEQLDLFGKVESARAKRDAYEEWFRSPPPCPSCGTVEPNGHQLHTNHGYDETGTICGWPPLKHPIYEDRCVAQHLKRNHIFYGVKNGLDITRDVQRARQLGMDVEAIVAEAEAEAELEAAS